QTEAVVSADCQKLCDSLLGAKVTIPTGTMFSSDRLLKILELVRFRSEARIFRDVTPLLVPSPELLYIDGHDSLEHVREAIDAEWTNCEPICGPQPKPDLTIGIAATAFTDEEIETMRLNCLHTCEILPSERIYCPFLICEAKGNRGTIEEADRQGMHAASIAVLSIVQLFTNISAIDEVDGRILAFSVSHNKEIIKIFGHFAVVRDGSPRYFRRRVFVTDFAEDVAVGQWHKTYGVVSAIYKNFYPQHLARIKSALSR
ncbi:uncharacterized protein K489DRAFT_304163, partial [Dissoconium aciculare CBS 342.82]|uniref:DUF7924 domain-containing protein n=1 Tax=Dissoconium aciculare CBS 342.82 TaxID=1314786 RepID=A0A6J3MFT9_9PEZI